MTVKVKDVVTGIVRVYRDVGYVHVYVERIGEDLFYFAEERVFSPDPVRILCAFHNVYFAINFCDVVNSYYKKSVKMLSFNVCRGQFSYTTEEREEELNEERE